MTGTVTATFEGITHGTVTFKTNTADGVLRDPSGNVLWVGPKKVRIVGGGLEVELPATDDAAYAETDWQWCAVIQPAGRTAPFLRWFELPDGDTVDLSSIAGELAPGDPLTHPIAYADVVADIQDPESVIGEALSASYVRTISPLDAAYGAEGDDTADDTAEVQAAITAAAAFGLAVDLRGMTYKTTDALTVPAGSDIRNGSIHCTGTGKKIINVTGSNVKLRHLSIIGRHAIADGADNETGICAQGASAAAAITGLLIEDCSVELVGKTGILLEYVDGFRLLRCDVGDIGYAGIGTKSALNGLIDDCRIDNVPGDNAVFGATDAYGVHFSRMAEDADLDLYPRSTNITISNCIVSNVPAWEGIDTHGGERIQIIDNIVLGCRNGIVAGGDDPGFGAVDITIKGNVVDSQVTDGTAGSGIILIGYAGATGSDPAVAYTTGAIIGNTVKNHGIETTADGGGIHVRNTLGVTIQGNIVEQPGSHGIVLYYDNRGVSVVGNTVADPWSSTQAASAIAVRGANNTGTIISNILLNTGARSAATNVAKHGVYNGSLPASVEVFVGLNNFTAATTSPLYDVSATARAETKFPNPIRAGANGPGTPAYSFAADPDTGIYNSGADQLAVSTGGTLRLRFLTTDILFSEGYHLDLGTTTGTKFGKSATQKLAFYGATPVVRPVLSYSRTGESTAAAALRSVLATLGLVTDSTTA